MELLALVLLLLNTANFRHARTSRLEVHPDWVWTILCLLRVRSLGGNLNGRRVTDGFTPFHYKKNKMEILLTILALVWSILCIILFIKVWKMCNNVQKIKAFLIEDLIRKNYDSSKEVLGLRPGDLVYDTYNRLCRINDITEEGKLVCEILNGGREITVNPEKVEKKNLQFVE